MRLDMWIPRHPYEFFMWRVFYSFLSFFFSKKRRKFSGELGLRFSAFSLVRGKVNYMYRFSLTAYVRMTKQLGL